MVTAEGAARLFLHQVWKLHSLPKCVILDHGPQFVACFTKELYRLLGIKLASSIAVRVLLRDKYPSSYWIVPEAKLRFK